VSQARLPLSIEKAAHRHARAVPVPGKKIFQNPTRSAYVRDFGRGPHDAGRPGQ